MEPIVQVPVVRFQGEGQALREDLVIREYAFALSYNGVLVEEGTCLPAQLEEMARGFLLTEGYVSDAGQIRSVQIRADGMIAAEGERGSAPLEARRLPPGRWDPQEVMAQAEAFLGASALFQATGSVHSALLTAAGRRYYAEDLGRHNAIDKAVGMALSDGADLSQGILYTSGRLPRGMAAKVVRAGIPVAVSRSAPTDLTLELAQKTGLTVIGFARAGRMNLYTPLSRSSAGPGPAGGRSG